MPPNGGYRPYGQYGQPGQGVQPQLMQMRQNSAGMIDPRAAVRPGLPVQPAVFGVAPQGWAANVGGVSAYPPAPYGPPRPAAFGPAPVQAAAPYGPPASPQPYGPVMGPPASVPAPAVIAPQTVMSGAVSAQSVTPAVTAVPAGPFGRTGISQMSDPGTPLAVAQAVAPAVPPQVTGMPATPLPVIPGGPTSQPQAQTQARTIGGFQFPASSATRYVQQMGPARDPWKIRPSIHIERRQIKPKAAVAVGAVLILLISGGLLAKSFVGGGGAAGGLGGKSADGLLQTALENAMSTKSYVQHIEDPVKGISAEYKVDVSNIEKPQLSGVASLTSTHIDLDGFATAQDTFTRIKAADKYPYPSAIGVWMQVRANGKVLDDTGSGGAQYDQLFTPTSALRTPVIFGNYSEDQRSELMGIIKDKLAIRYDPTAAQDNTVDGQEVTQYDVTFDREGSVALFRKAAVLDGYDQKRIDEAVAQERLSSGSSQTPATVYVSKQSKRIVRLDLRYKAGTRSVKFSGFDSTDAGAAPKPQYRWDQFVAERISRH